MRKLALLCTIAWMPAALAQTTYKCVDNQNRLTYSNIACEKQGLKASGTVTEDRVTTMPLPPPPKPAPKPPAESPKGDAEPAPAAAQVKPVNPLIEKISK
jgi:hypothetical protein